MSGHNIRHGISGTQVAENRLDSNAGSTDDGFPVADLRVDFDFLAEQGLQIPALGSGVKLGTQLPLGTVMFLPKGTGSLNRGKRS
jgi:hypothetical protein